VIVDHALILNVDGAVTLKLAFLEMTPKLLEYATDGNIINVSALNVKMEEHAHVEIAHVFQDLEELIVVCSLDVMETCMLLMIQIFLKLMYAMFAMEQEQLA